MMLLFSFLIGAIVGSFLNVCIFRLPENRSVVRPRSCCPHCGAPIAARDNIPILSFLLLRGRCRICAAPISMRYPFVEALTGAAAIAAYAHYGMTPQAVVAFAFLAALIAITFIDLDHQIIPDVITVPGIVLGFATSFLPGGPTWIDSLTGAAIGFGILWAVAEAFFRLTGREGMGGGDLKLLAMVGAFLGWRSVFVTLLLASLGGTLGAAVLIALKRHSAAKPIPFGPFLAAGATCSMFFGSQFLNWYLGLFAFA